MITLNKENKVEVSELESGIRIKYQDWDERYLDVKQFEVIGDTVYIIGVDEDGEGRTRDIEVNDLDEWEIVEVDEDAEVAQDWLVEFESGALGVISNLTEDQLLENVYIIRYQPFEVDSWIDA